MWKWWCLCCVLLHLCAKVSNQRNQDSPFIFGMVFYRQLQSLAINLVFDETETKDDLHIETMRKEKKTQETVPDNIPFPCNVTDGRSQEVPDSVHKLRPGDIDVIAAMGDSITAGAGVFSDNLFQIMVENRGVTATGGGQGTWRQYLTIPNIIKEFNPNLTGYALSDSLASHEASQLNVAESGALSQEMPYMAEVLIERIKNDSRIDLEKHWKFISLMIGINNFCTDGCKQQSPSSILEKHKADMLQVLRTLRDNLPRTFVALILPPHMKFLVNSRANETSFKCYVTTKIACSCLYSLKNQSLRQEYYDIMKRWHELDMEIATYPEFNKTDFVVVAQPILSDMIIPFTADGYGDMTYFASDCFHFSQKTHSLYANGLWNNLMEPYGVKSTNWNNFLERFICPTSERPYLATMLN